MRYILALFFCASSIYAGYSAVLFPFPSLESSWWPIIDINSNNGVNGQVHAIAVDGDDLYVGGDFIAAGGVVGANYIAKFNTVSSTWSALGNGANDPVRDICIVGSDIYIGGEFTFPRIRVARWDGASWRDVGLTGANGPVFELEAGPNGDLYMGGNFTSPAPFLARWDGTSWHAVGDPLDNRVFSISVSTAGDVYVGGLFENVGGIAGADFVAKYDGGKWSALGDANFPIINDAVTALAMVDSILFIGGEFVGGPELLEFIVSYDTVLEEWKSLGEEGLDGPVHEITAGDSSIFVGGAFRLAGRVVAPNIAEWDGNWKPLGEGVGGRDSAAVVSAISIRDSSVYAGGLFSDVGPTNAPRALRDAINLGLFTNTASFPVELVSFLGYCSAEVHVLEWETASEINSDLFEIQSRSESADWSTIGRVPAEGAGTYSFTYAEPSPGLSFYRLKIIDLDGSFEYGKIINLRSDLSVIELYPTIVEDRLFLAVEEDFLRVDILDMSGRFVGTWRSLEINVGDFPAGRYNARIVNRNGSVVRSFLKR